MISGSLFKNLINIVGTHWLWVTLNFSIASRAASGSNFSKMMLVAPRAKNPVLNPIGAEWYKGAGDR